MIKVLKFKVQMCTVGIEIFPTDGKSRRIVKGDLNFFLQNPPKSKKFGTYKLLKFWPFASVFGTGLLIKMYAYI